MNAQPSSPLDNLHVATPCRAAWENMAGTDQVRFCQTCAKNVYNLSMMSRDEAERLIRAKEGKLCVRFYQREDGTVLTNDCPVGARVARRRLWGGLAAGLAACGAFAAGLIGLGKTPHDTPNNFVCSRFQHLRSRFAPQPQPMTGVAVMGDMPARPQMMGKPAMPVATPAPMPPSSE
jgi:hypothetical protein